ncbi:G-type lectin S-receptor-like serine/threonine-protein kinase [Tanacetum coccineum]
MITLIILTILCTNLFTNPAKGVSTITLGDQLNSSFQLVSPGNNFTLGFFNISATNFTYLGIWYTNDDRLRRVWVANPSIPIISSSSVLMINPNTSKLIISFGGTTLVNISDNQSGRDSNLIASLEDTGNFQLRNETDNSIIWQSFDHPTNVLLPGMKLGADLRTGQTWNLTSWFTDDRPDSGAFTLSWEPNGESSQRLTIRRRGNPYWTSGDYLNNQTFEYMIGLNNPFSRYWYNLSYVYNNDERYFSYRAFNGVMPMWTSTPDGRILDVDSSFVWSPEFCYGYETDTGCVESSNLPRCRSDEDMFRLLNGDFAPMTDNSFDSNASLILSDCMVRCWNDCGCLGYRSSSNGTGCVTWTGTKFINNFTINDQGVALSKYVLISPTTSKEERQNRDDEYFLELMASDSFEGASNIERNGRKGSDLMVFSFATIVAATNDFASENKLGEGGFGPVYKGKLSDEREIAIKRLSKTSGQGLVEFKNELILIAKLQHTNLVRVLGCCIRGEEKMLIYEYMPNKSLDFFLFDETRKALLDWPKRWKIIEGIAQGLLYLHKYLRMRVIHRDLKASNVLLDVNMNPKISDFGMARIFKQNETEAMTNRVVGTYGYMSPEYAMEGTFSEKSDVFSFGVLVLEIVSGRRNTSFTLLDRTLNLIGYAWELWQQGDALQLEDPTLGDTCVIQQLLRTIHVALLCVQENALDRPLMSDVISMLINDTMLLPAPKRPAFFFGTTPSKSSSAETKSENYSELQELILLLLITVNSPFGLESRAALAPLVSSSRKVIQSLLKLHPDGRPVESGVGPVATLMCLDFYDVSLVDGYNLPMLIEPTSGSSFDSPTMCKPTAYAQLFKSACPRSYSTAYDDTATYMCSGSDYTIRFCPASDSFSTIKLGSQLKSNDQLVSTLGNFTLGVFNEDNKYLGIWYKSDVESKKVWVANPDDPIVSGSMDHALSIDAKTGNLIITSASSTLMHIMLFYFKFDL